MSATLPPESTKTATAPAINPFQSATVATPTGTLNITLTPAPSPKTPFFENPTAWVPIVTLVGVIITIIAGWLKTKMELKAAASEAKIERDQSREQAQLERRHDAEQAHLARITQARREVYLEVVSEVIAAQAALALLTEKDIQKLDVDGDMRGLVTAVAKISLLGEIKTVETSWALMNTINQGLVQLMSMLIPYNERKWEADHHEQKTNFNLSEINRLSDEIRSVRETTNNSEELERLKRSMEFRRVDMETHGEAAIAAKRALLELQEKYADAVRKQALEIGQKVDELVVCIRAELSLPTSLEPFHALRTASYKASQAATDELRATMKNGGNEVPQ